MVLEHRGSGRPSVVFTVGKDGAVTADAIGFEGAACETALAAFDVLSNPEARIEDKPELWLPESSQSQRQEARQ